MSNNPDFIDRKVDGVVKIFGLTDKNFMALVLTVSILLNVLLVWKLLDVYESSTERIVQEVKKQSPQIIREEATRQFAEPKAQIDSTLNIVREVLTTGGKD